VPLSDVFQIIRTELSQDVDGSVFVVDDSSANFFFFIVGKLHH